MIKETNAPEETFAFGKMLGEQAKPGEVICLNGDLGVGKTVFTKGFAEGLGITEPVNSPTFTIASIVFRSIPTSFTISSIIGSRVCEWVILKSTVYSAIVIPSS